MVENKKRGRKQKHIVNILKTRVWIEYLLQLTELSVDQLEMQIAILENQSIDKAYRLRRYVNGDHIPEIAYINKIEGFYPGSKAIFEHLLWVVLLTFERNQDEINDLIQKLQPEVKKLLISDLNEESVERKYFNESTVKMLIDLGTIDCFVVAVLMIQESIFLGSEKLRELALELYLGLTEKIAQNPLFFKIHPELFNYMDMSFKHYIFIAPNIRLSAVIFWQAYRDNFWANDTKKSSEILEQSKKYVLPKEITPKTRVESLDGNSYFD
ncbi:hypothetical protein [Acinetobacter wuhouensis]|uniref:Uncharacterized protein n=1 Tax=Acinetobacter wuhouensis TaxID=1879050 RepID=A0A4Q7AFE4_9GAMM|nr:hypothetical protein [Acinetobacter wuhouensis]RZG43272.1 hypothetical protein EXU28_17695 [Acinetobacter wuhouensis]